MEHLNLRVTELLGRSPPIARLAPLVIQLQSSHSSESPPVFTAQGIVDSRLHQKLFINLSKYTRTEAIEGTCRLLCNRYLIDRQNLSAISTNDELATAPDWLSVGVALNISPGQGRRFQRMAHALWSEGELPHVEQCLEMRELPERVRPRQEAVSYAFVNWLISTSVLRDVFARILESGPEGKIRTSAIAAEMDVADIDELERKWELFVANFSNIENTRSFSDSMESLRRIENALHSIPSQYSLLAGEPVGLDNMLDFRNAKWMPDMCGRMSFKLNVLSITSNQDLRRLINVYRGIFNDMLEPKADNLFDIIVGKISNKSLQKRLDEADALREKIKKRLEEYDAYLDRVEENVYNQDVNEGSLPTEEQKEYIERIENQFSK